MTHRFLLAIFLLVAFIARSLNAASEHSGRVTLGGQPVPGARVTASQGSQNLATSTDREGVYRFAALTEGVWNVRVEMLGFSTMTRDVTIGATPSPATWELTVLPFGDITRGVASPPPPAPRQNPSQRRTQSSESAQATGPAAATVGGAFQRAGVSAVPAAAGRPLAAPATAAPAAGPAPGGPGEPAAANPSASGDSFLVSGTVNSGTLPQPTVGNVRRPTGIRLFNGQISISPHYSALEARPHSLTGIPADKPNTTSLSVNSTVFGPWRIPGLMRNARQFNVSYRRQSTDTANTLSERMPTALQRGGDFSQTLDGFGLPVEIKDPLTGLPFAGNVIPLDRISPQAAYLLQFYPLPDPEATGTRNYQIAALSANSSDSFNGQLPNLFSNTTNQVGFSGGYTRSRSESTSLFGFDSTNEGSGYNAAINWAHRWVPSNQQVRFTYSYNRQTNSTTPFFANRINVSGEAGITGNNQNAPNWGPPGLSFANSIAGLSDAQFSLNRTQSHTFGATSSRTRGRHNMTSHSRTRAAASRSADRSRETPSPTSSSACRTRAPSPTETPTRDTAGGGTTPTCPTTSG
jgi:carboxypeptidase family protein